MILIEVRGKIFNPAKIKFLTNGGQGTTCLWFNSEEPDFHFEDVTPHVLASEINDAIYDHEYLLEQKRLEARNHFTNPMEK